MTNPSIEKYLKAIYELSTTSGQGVSTNMLSKKMNIKPSSVSQMIQKLDLEGFVSYRKYMGVKLSDKGRKVAIKTIRKHRLWEVFLTKKLKFRWDEVKVLAEQLEHIGSDNIANRLDSFLDYPKEDPMGLPIPDEDGQVKDQLDTMSIYELDNNDRAMIIGVLDHSSEFLKYLTTMGLTIGVPFIFKNRIVYDDSVNIILGLKEVMLSKQVAMNLVIKRTSPAHHFRS